MTKKFFTVYYLKIKLNAEITKADREIPCKKT